MNDILVGNICSLCAMISDSFSGTRKKRGEMLAVQILSQFFYGAGSIVLKGYSGSAQNAVAVLRNLAAIRGIHSRALEWTLAALGVVLGAAFNNRGLIGWLPIVANLQYSLVVFRCGENGKSLKVSFIVCMLMFTVFSAAIRNYVGIAANLFIAFTTGASLLREARRRSV